MQERRAKRSSRYRTRIGLYSRNCRTWGNKYMITIPFLLEPIQLNLRLEFQTKIRAAW